MKTNTFKFSSLVLMAVLMIGLTSCEIEHNEFYDDDAIGGQYYNRSSVLTSRTWVSFYRDKNGNPCRQELDFFIDRTGVDFTRVEYPNGNVETFEYKFRWNWENYAQTSIQMAYGPKDVSFLDNIYLSENRLTGYLNGRDNYVEFQRK